MTIEKLELEKEKYSKELKSYYNYLKESEKDVKKIKDSYRVPCIHDSQD